MKFKDRLAHLGSGAPLGRRDGSPARPAAAGAPAATTVTARGGAAEEPRQSIDATPLAAAKVESVADPLAELRGKIAAIMGKSALGQAPGGAALAQGNDRARTDPADWSSTADPALSTLPFVEIEYGAGRLCQRLERQGLSARVGRIELSAARQAQTQLLSLLALDPSLAEIDPAGALYFDTETTGLGGAGTLAFLLGMAWFDEHGQLVMEQLLLRQPAEELAFLARFEELVARSSCLVSYNGRSFDWPLLQSRRVMNRLRELERKPHLDLLHVARRIHKRRLERCKLIDLESHVLGWERGEDDIPGAEIAPRYGHFLRTGDEEALRAVIDHNAWDVLSMVALVGLYGEPLDVQQERSDLHDEDWLGIAQTLGRARAFEQAEHAAERAIAGGAETEGLRVRARLHQARGDKTRALADFEALSEKVDDAEARLALAKLFEHHVKDFERALSVVKAGTGEDDEALAKRRARLERKQLKRPETPGRPPKTRKK